LIVVARRSGGTFDDEVLFLSDIVPTGYMAAADFCNLKGGETVAIWGVRTGRSVAIRSAFLSGAERVLAIDTWPSGSILAREAGADFGTRPGEDGDFYGDGSSACPASGNSV
jgi:threonine dehydrogenase-like Zn-dependent dehydrogenase